MKSSGTVNYAAKIKEEPNDMCYNENDDGEIEDETSETKNLQYLRCLQENTVHTLEEPRKINEFQPKGPSINYHRKVVHPKQLVKSNSKKTATRIIKRRDDEVLCVVKESQDVEWVENEDLIVESPDPSQESDKKDEDLPIINSIEGWLKYEWEDVD
ncbi:hypothetical protein TKK_0016424 [Trichogramma kaykai]